MKQKEKFEFKQLDSILKKINPNSSFLENESISKITEYINSGNYIFNAQLSGSLFGGYGNTKIYTLAGETSTGKTFLALNAAHKAQLQGYNIIYIDTESAIDETTIANFGIDTEKFSYQPINLVSELKYFMSNLFKELNEKSKLELPKLLIILDSLGNLATDKEFNDAVAGNDKKDMTRQQEIRSLFRLISVQLAKFKIPMIITSHVYNSMSFIPTNEVSGGGGIKYISSVILELSKAQLKEKDTQTGIIVTSKVKKSRFVKPIKVKFHISFYKGMNPYVGLEEYISWETCGIGRGQLIDEKTFEKLYANKNDSNSKYIQSTKFEIEKDGKLVSYYFQPDDKSKFIANKHIGENISIKELFTEKVFSKKVLELLDENVIKPTFKLSSISEISDLELEDFENIVE